MTDKNIMRIFPRRTSHTPDDDFVAIGEPGLFIPNGIDEVHVSCVFDWDKAGCIKLGNCWRERLRGIPVLVGGPAFESPCDDFVPGRYAKIGITYTTRGCDMGCDFCLVGKREGRFREISEICPGNIIQDNNILLASENHLRRVFDMLAEQRAIKFSGGLDTRLLTQWHVDEFAKLRIAELWIAFDDDERRESVGRALEMLTSAGFARRKIRCYVLGGRGDITESEARCRFVWDGGGLPFAQLYQPPDFHIDYSKVWRAWQRRWSRPAATFAYMTNTLRCSDNQSPKKRTGSAATADRRPANQWSVCKQLNNRQENIMTKIEKHNPEITRLAKELNVEIHYRAKAWWCSPNVGGMDEWQLTFDADKRSGKYIQIKTIDQKCNIAIERLRAILDARQQPRWGCREERIARVVDGLKTEAIPAIRWRGFTYFVDPSMDCGSLSLFVSKKYVSICLIGEKDFKAEGKTFEDAINDAAAKARAK